ncbi:hypothetical protein PPTG_13667 [Phytophthora nicotianae INRA-310]|uniref:Uncharacterized protein n=1 Tax=Phytophthora nicotianae (strain INRA-310) TaxID=761204 RepID=W2Q0D0_PHYN3|nr:hypothetical protein PPTG_13667 [Phytophthora nicotianae INRA-310]ETN06311.1 hypothetical protein PPTG_13667 [Phytophthora nicotianae INRA-310]
MLNRRRILLAPLREVLNSQVIQKHRTGRTERAIAHSVYCSRRGRLIHDVERVIHLDYQEGVTTGEAIKHVWQGNLAPRHAVRLSISEFHDNLAVSLMDVDVRWQHRQARRAKEVIRRSRVKERAQWSPGAGDMENDNDQSRVTIRGGGITTCM